MIRLDRAALLLVLAASPLSAGTLHDPREIHFSDVRQLTLEGDNAEAYWSSDGTRLIFQSSRAPFACDQIFTLPVFPAGEPKLVSSGQGRTTCSFFLEGDQKILWAATDAYANECPPPPDMSQGYVWPISPDYEIFVANPDGSGRVRLTENRAYDAEATVCPVDGSVIFTSTRDGDLDLYRMNADGSEVKRLTSTPGYDGGAFYSADCSQIVWRASHPKDSALEEYRKLLGQGLVRPTKLELWVANADGTDARQITDLGAASFAPFFYPSGDRILFSSNYGDPKGREFDLWAINTNGTDLERITYTGGFDGFPMFSPDGKHLAFASNRNQGRPGETDIYVADWVEGTRGRTVERGADRFEADAAWLADDAREGRGIGLPGLAAAGGWLEQRFRALGLAPAGVDGSYRQPFPVEVAVRSTAATKLVIEGQEIAIDQFVPTAFSASGPVEGEVVAAGWGITAGDKKYDDYASVDVKGKIALVRRFVPEGDAFKGTDQERRWGDLRYKAFDAREHGAIGLLVADLAVAAGGDAHGAPAEAPLPRLTPDEGGSDAGIPVLVVTRAAAERLTRSGVRARMTIGLEHDQAPAFNVLARLEPGRPPIDDRIVVVGAHYDHLGRGGPGSLDPGSTAIHNGADDNASGVAAMLEAARLLAARKQELGRPVVFVAFAGEERGLLGSSYLVRHPTPALPLDRMQAMINLDMVGRLRGESLTIFGIDSAEEWKTEVPEVCNRLAFECKANGDGYGPSDQTSFYAAGVPVLHLFTGTHDQYHRPSDDAPLLYATGGARVATLAAEFARDAADRAGALTLRRASAPPAPRGDIRSFGASLGTVPDYAGPGEGKSGMLLAGVRPSGPADQAGLRRGDIIVGLSGREIRGVEDLMFVLRQAHPGEATKIVIERDGQRLELPAVFGEASRRN
jgi:Iap family predicted aminopeptidase